MKQLSAVLLSTALLLAPVGALAQSFTGPAMITQPTTKGDCVKINSTRGQNYLSDAGAACVTSGGAAGGDLGGTYPNPTVLHGTHITDSSIPNSGLAHPSMTIAGHSVALGGTQTLSCADLTDCTTGSWTPSDQSGATLTFTSVSANYTKIGNMVFVYGTLTWPSTSNSANVLIGGLPFTAANAEYGYAPFFANTGANAATYGTVLKNSTTFNMQNISTGASLTNANMSLKQIRFTVAYPVN